MGRRPAGYWSKERIKSLKCKSVTELYSISTNAVRACIKNGWLKEIFPESTYVYTPPHTIEECREVALKYSSRYEFRKNDERYYDCAKINNWLHDVCSHMKYVYDIDVNYMWNSHEYPSIWKIGASNRKKYMNRIRRVARQAKLTPYRIITVRHDNKARQLEHELLKIGKPIDQVSTFDGSSEFRYMTDDNVRKCKQLMSAVGDLFGG